jgi:hypothetical protein
MNLNLIKELQSRGIVKIDNFLDEKEKEKVKEIIKFYSAPKGHKDSYFPISMKSLILKLLKLNFTKLKHSYYILNLSKKKKLNLISDKIFEKKSYLRFIDGYYSMISDKDVLPWHTDQAYKGDEKNISGFVHPDHAFLKFFIYLTDVGPDDGCMSYIPESHKIGYAIRKGIFEKKIEYESYWSLKDFRKIISNKKNINFFKNYFNDSNLIDEFLEKTNFIEKNEETKDFDYKMPAGGAIIFNEGGVHKGSKTLYNNRMVLRFLFSIKKN